MEKHLNILESNSEIISDIEKEIRSYFRSRWGSEDINYYIGNNRFELDVEALNSNINIPIRDFVLRGGKRIRPVLFLKCLEFFGKDPAEYMDIAVLIELVHNGTLVLDDIEDKGLLRRGLPTCHIKFGLDTATNVGMGLHVLPLRILLSRDDLSTKQQLGLWQIYAEELINVSFGQGLDIYWHKNNPNGIRIQKYLEMVRLKTGSLMRMSLRAACVIANKDKKTEKLFSEFAESIGMAFQIVDDTLDLEHITEKFGKTYGNDITEGKLSLPVIYALKKVSPEVRKRLEYILSKHTRDKRLIQEAIEIIGKTKSLEDAKEFAYDLVDNAWDKLERNWKGKQKLDDLKTLAYFLVKRKY